jgi:hypothetical protein
MTNSFLPEGYKVPEAASNYLKFSVGETRFRILSDAIHGYLYWVQDKDGNNKPVRYRQMPSVPPSNDGPVRFLTMAVMFNNNVYVLEITQKSIIAAVAELANNADWGHPYQYDIIIKRSGQGMDTRYHVTPCPKTALRAEQVEAMQKKPVYLERLYDGGNPFEEAPGYKQTEYHLLPF